LGDDLIESKRNALPQRDCLLNVFNFEKTTDDIEVKVRDSCWKEWKLAWRD